jgi:DNA-binding SARP family transcriptional activator
MIDLRLIGGIEVRSSEVGGNRASLTQPKRLALLMYLALAEPAGQHSRDRLLALLWPDADDASSRHSLRNALHALRRALGDDAIVTRGESWIGLDFDVLECDVLELRAHLAAGRVEEAIALWSCDLAPGFHLSGAPEFDWWLEEQRTTLARGVRASAWHRARELEGTGAAEIDAVRRAIQIDPLNEPGTRRLMELLSAAGDRSGALRAYQDLADRLAHELETGPSAETHDAAQRLRGVASANEPARMREVPNTRQTSAAVIPAPAPPPDAITPTQPIRRRTFAIGLATAAALAGIAYLSQAGVARGSGAASSPVQAIDPAAAADRAALRLPPRYRADTAAFSSYLRGLTLRFQFQFRASRDTLAALVDRKPLYVPGLYALAHAWIFLALNDQSDPDDAWPRADVLARRALALDSTAANAWLVLASEDEYLHHDLARAGDGLTRARALDPFDPDVAGMRSVWFRFQGQMDSAVAEARLAYRLDPFSLMHERLVAKQLFYARRYEESRQAYLRMLQNSRARTPGYRDLGQLSAAMGRPRDAVEWLRQAYAAEGDSAGAAALSGAATEAEARQLLAADARRTIARLERAALAHQRVKPANMAAAFAALGDTAATLRWLDSMRVRRDSYLLTVPVDPAFDFVRREPEYRTWQLRSGLPATR